jgi:hypothetical protein
MEQLQHKVPPNIVIYLKREIDVRAEYKRQLEALPVYNGYDDFTKRQYEGQKLTLEGAMKDVMKTIVVIARRYLPHVVIDEANPELTIASILAVLPAPEEIVIKRVYHSVMAGGSTGEDAQ